MVRTSTWWIVGAILAILGVALAAAYMGWLGPLVVCGADGVAVCVAWPGAVSAAVWALYILFFSGVAAWQVMMWRREPTPAPWDDDGIESHE
jgi:membrane protein implicated in regulation of membrane protease activity